MKLNTVCVRVRAFIGVRCFGRSGSTARLCS